MSRMHKVYATVLGLALWTAVSAPLVAQRWQDVPGPLHNDSIGHLPGNTYFGIPLTDAQKTKLAELKKKRFEEVTNPGSKQQWDDTYRAVLTPEQQKILDRNIQIHALFSRAHLPGRYSYIFMGLNLTDAQMTEFQKLVAARKEKKEKEKKEKSAEVPTTNVEVQQGTQELAKFSDALYVLLTPEQQRMAAPRIKQVQEIYAHSVMRRQEQQSAAKKDTAPPAKPSR
jgi:Spy/CpxP family protein refolding chaperone